jgi:hypothetical protein
MALADMDWTEISIHNVVLEFLRGEREKLMGPLSWLPVIDTPNLNDPLENYRRLRLLYLPRGKFMIEIPPDTKLLTRDEARRIAANIREAAGAIAEGLNAS